MLKWLSGKAFVLYEICVQFPGKKDRIRLQMGISDQETSGEIAETGK